jgi:hypothetical protein
MSYPRHEVLSRAEDHGRIAPNAIQPADQFVSTHPAENNITPLWVGRQAQRAYHSGPG